MHLCVMLYCGMTDWTSKSVNWDVFSETGDPKVQCHDSVMLKKKQAEEHSRKSSNQRNAAILWGMNVDERRAMMFSQDHNFG